MSDYDEAVLLAQLAERQDQDLLASLDEEERAFVLDARRCLAAVTHSVTSAPSAPTAAEVAEHSHVVTRDFALVAAKHFRAMRILRAAAQRMPPPPWVSQ